MGVVAAVRAGLGVAVLPESALANRLTAINSEHGLPDVGEIELAIFGEREGRASIASTFVGFIEASLRQICSPALTNLLNHLASDILSIKYQK